MARAKRSFLVAVIGLALALAWQSLVVQVRYNGDWTSAFYCGAKFERPSQLPACYSHANSNGYDAQFYRLAAFDPLANLGLGRYFDDPGYRYERILVPAAAHALALGNSASIHTAYYAVIAIWVFLGIFAAAQLAAHASRSPWLGLLFLLMPATLTSIDRMTVDVAIAALCCLYVLNLKRPWALVLITALACLTRESGLLLVIAGIIRFALQPSRRLWILPIAASAIPYFTWVFYVRSRFPVERSGDIGLPLAGYLTRLIEPYPHAVPGIKYALMQAGDYASLFAVGLALIFAFQARRDWRNTPELAISLLPVLLISHPDVWSEPYAFGRTMNPLWLFLAIRALQTGNVALAAPFLIIGGRILAQMAFGLLQAL